MDSTDFVQRYFDDMMAGYPAYLPEGKYEIARTLNIVFIKDVFRPKFIMYGRVFKSTIINATPVLTIKVLDGVTVRGALFAGLTILGSGADSNGIDIQVPTNSSWFYNFKFVDISIEKCGGTGLYAVGSIFEGVFENVCCRDNNGCGVSLGSSIMGGVMSSVTWRDGSVGQNGKYGFELLNGFYNLSLEDTYILENGLAGISCANGLMRMQGGGLENNQQTSTGPAIVGQNFATLIGVTEGGNNGKQTSLMGGFYSVSRVNLIGCVLDHGIGAVAGPGVVNNIGS